jgi:DNA-binding SARP family transcriptional activator
VAAAARALTAGLPVSPPPRVFTVLGGFSVRRGGWQVRASDWGRRSAARLVRYLLVCGGVPVPEEVVFETFWPHLSPTGARHSLQVAASRLRAVLDHPGADSVLEVVEGAYRLRLDEADVLDSVEFDAVATSAFAAGPPDRALLERARALWTGEPLPEDRYADWAASWREGLLDTYAQVLTALVDCYEEEGDHGRAIKAGRELVELDLLDEAAHRKLMTVYARAGRTGRALRQYLECRRALAEVGAEPTAATSALQARLLAGEALGGTAL